MPDQFNQGEQVFRGIPVSGGVARGRILILGKPNESIPRYEVSEEEVAGEVDRLEAALVQTRLELLEVQHEVEAAMGSKDASIFDAHLLVLEDRTLIDEVVRLLRSQRWNVEQAFYEVSERYAKALGAIADDYLRERAVDMRDVTGRILDHLQGKKEVLLKDLKEPCIIVCHDLLPSTTAQLDKRLVLGFATDGGGKTSHTGIIALGLGIPAIVGLKEASTELESGMDALVDGYQGLLIINPTDRTLFEYGQLVRKQLGAQERLRALVDLPAVTLDGQRIVLSANIGSVEEAEAVRASGAEGVGLFRTEFLFLDGGEVPSEEEQYVAYRKVAEALKPHPVVIRTLDLGGDKFLADGERPAELNPFLGWRAIRYCLQELRVFRAQLRAILRASTEGNVKIMYPMISSVGELAEANIVLEQCRAELRAEGIAFDPKLEVGMMIEVPSAALVARSLGKQVSFFSIGSNDLIQYCLAVDRLNERIAHLYQPTHPAVLRLIQMTVEAGNERQFWTGVCGEMASDLTLVPLLLGMGVTELSVAPSLVGGVKCLIRSMDLREARELALFALGCDSAEEIQARSEAMARRIAPSLFELKDLR